MKNSKKLVISSLFAALACIATIVVKIPIPATGGYFNLGDCVVLLSGWMLGPVYGFAAAAIGSSLADIISGYAGFAIPTFIIKGIMAVIAYYLMFFKNSSKPRQIIGQTISSVVSEIFMCSGYFLVESLIFGNGWSALAGVPMNLLQGVVGALAAILLYQKLKPFKII